MQTLEKVQGTPIAYVVEQIDPVVLSNGPAEDAADLMSPYVWREDGRYRMMLRVVPRGGEGLPPTGLIYGAQSTDGLSFILDDKPSITPSDDDDASGCEDPTVLLGHGRYLVFYTGVDAERRQGALLLAAGPDLTHLTKQPVQLKAPPGEGNIKEATLAQTPDGQWRLFYEYAARDASRIGMASGPTPDGPWTVMDDPFGIREDSWDNWHLSTGPVVTIEGHDPVMFYNGATVDARWRIGWISFDPTFSQVTGRGLEPLLVPPPAVDRAATDIAFAASCIVEEGQVSLYYSLEDRKLRRARVQVYGQAGREASQRGDAPKAPPGSADGDVKATAQS
jgi:predicted GH43/DUF377 family glycosyl hydrolase